MSVLDVFNNTKPKQKTDTESSGGVERIGDDLYSKLYKGGVVEDIRYLGDLGIYGLTIQKKYDTEGIFINFYESTIYETRNGIDEQGMYSIVVDVNKTGYAASTKLCSERNRYCTVNILSNMFTLEEMANLSRGVGNVPPPHEHYKSSYHQYTMSTSIEKHVLVRIENGIASPDKIIELVKVAPDLIHAYVLYVKEQIGKTIAMLQEAECKRKRLLDEKRSRDARLKLLSDTI